MINHSDEFWLFSLLVVHFVLFLNRLDVKLIYQYEVLYFNLTDPIFHSILIHQIDCYPQTFQLWLSVNVLVLNC